MSYTVIHMGSGNAPWAYDNAEEACACAEEASEDGSEWAVVRLGVEPADTELICIHPKDAA